MRTLFLFIALLAAPTCLASEQKWYALIVGSGCKPLDRLYRLFPYLDGKTTPEGLKEAMNAKYNDAKLEPFLTAMWRELRESGEEQNTKDKEFFSHFTRTNALLLTGNEGKLAIPLVTEALCAEIHLLPPAASAPVAASAPAATPKK